MGSSSPSGSGAIGIGVAGLGIGLASLLAGSLSPLEAHPALAECNPNRTNDYYINIFDGWGRANTAVTDVSSEIKDVDTWVYTSPSDNSVFGWTMLANASHTRFAQVGWQEVQGNTRKTFSFYTTNDGVGHWGSSGSITLNSAPAFKTHFDPAYGKFYFYVDGNQLGPATPQMNWSPGEALISGETWTRASQMPGTISAHDTYRNTIVKLGANWYNFGSTIRYLTDGSIHAGSKNSASSYDIWDKACS